jgi:gliding motility-associated-like protein
MRLILFLFFSISFCSIFAQQNTLSAGGEATGSAGSLSYSIGQVDYENASDAVGSMELGVQHAYDACNFSILLTNSITTTIGCQTALASLLPIANQPNATFTWSATNTGGTVTGFTTSGTGNINEVLTNTDTSQGIVVYAITPYVTTCVGTPSNYTVVVNPLPSITLTNNSPVCEGDTVVISATSANATSYSWSGPNGFASNNQNVNLQNASLSASGNYSLTVVDNNNCINTEAAAISISSAPTADAGQDVEICPGKEITLAASGGTTYSWLPLNNISVANTSNPVVNPKQSQTYTVVVINANGCSDVDTITVLVKKGERCNFHIYGNFTPNGDDVNDGWQIDGLDNVKKLEIHIYNRWGAEVWKTNQYDNKSKVWKGENQKGEPLPDGTYFYIIKADDEKFNGYVEINR